MILWRITYQSQSGSGKNCGVTLKKGVQTQTAPLNFFTSTYQGVNLLDLFDLCCLFVGIENIVVSCRVFMSTKRIDMCKMFRTKANTQLGTP